MKTNIQFIDMPVSETLSNRIEQNLNKLAEKYNWMIGAEVKLKKENTSSPDGNLCEIQLSVPGPYLFVKSRQDNFEKAARVAIDELTVQLEKRKQQILHH